MTDTKAADELVLAIHAEELAVSKRVAVRTVQVRRETLRHEARVDEALATDGVVIERVPVGRFIEEMPAVREEDGLIILPVVEEIVVVERRLRLVEEVHIRRVRTTAAHVETVTLREQHVVVIRSDPVIQAEPFAAIPVTAPSATNLSRRMPMSNETIVAVFDTAAHAEKAVADLLAAKVPQSAIHRHAAGGSYSANATTMTERQPDAEGGFWSNLFGGSSEDHSVYERTLEGGGNVVSVATVPEHDYDAVMAILEQNHPVDIDERAASYTGTADTTAVAPMTSTMAASSYTGAATTGTVSAEQGGVIQLAEESLAVGKRLVNRGGTRVRRYVVETPVEESVTLHEEKVTLLRRPVTDGRPVTDADFTDKTIELTETAEEAVVSKTARVVEEVSLGKTATDRVETIHETLRKEEVDIEQIPGSTTTKTTTTPDGTFKPKV